MRYVPPEASHVDVDEEGCRAIHAYEEVTQRSVFSRQSAGEGGRCCREYVNKRW